MNRAIICWGLAVFMGGCFECRGESIKRGSHEHVMAWGKGAQTRFVFRVVDADGLPVENASIQASFGEKWGGWNKGATDSNGVFAVEGISAGEMIYNIRKQNYYDTDSGYKWGGADEIIIEDGKWLPWGVTNSVILKKIRNPVAMCVKHVESKLPALNQPCSYDFKIGDWVAPFGKGEIEDVVFLVTKKRISTWTDFDGALSVCFKNKSDGFRERDKESATGSLFAWSYETPTNGYFQNLSINIGYVPGQQYYETNQSSACYFRTRSVTNNHGEVVSANYGKIIGSIVFDVRDTPTAFVKFTYYFNPIMNDRNIEFDPEKNLFGGRDRFAP